MFVVLHILSLYISFPTYDIKLGQTPFFLKCYTIKIIVNWKFLIIFNKISILNKQNKINKH